MENFVKNQFLPIVHVDYRTRVANALASKLSIISTTVYSRENPLLSKK
jgi:hypothetical protein